MPRTVMSIVLVLLLGACSIRDDTRALRAERAAEATGDIVVGTVWPWTGPKGALWQGVELAVEEINANGGVLKRKLRVVKEDDESSLSKGRLIAQKFAENRDMVAVIGHLNSYIALPASAIYQSAGLLYITPGASSYLLNTQGYDLTFRAIPSNRSIGRRMAEDMAARGIKRVVIYYVKDKNSQGAANFFEQRARELDLTIVDRRSYLHGARDFSVAIQNWKDLYQFDAMFLAASMPEAAYIVSQTRKMGLDVPIFGNEGLDTDKLMEMSGAAAEGVRLPEFAGGDDAWPAYRHFKERFTQKYGQPPSALATQGYDAVQLLAYGINKANSSVPDKVALALHSTKGWPGASGEFTFDDKGDTPDKKIGVKLVHEGKFETAR